VPIVVASPAAAKAGAGMLNNRDENRRKEMNGMVINLVACFIFQPNLNLVYMVHYNQPV
jgi:hypothetical protein